MLGMSLQDTLIFDRTQQDVDEVTRLRDKILSSGLDSLTEDERTAWFSEMKGACDASTLNRVGTVMNYLRDELDAIGITVDVDCKTDWTYDDVPTVADMDKYIRGVQSINNSFAFSRQDVPTTMKNLTYEKLNQIEQMLYNLFPIITLVAPNWVFSDEVYSGEVY